MQQELTLYLLYFLFFGTLWFIGDLISQSTTGKGISDNIADWLSQFYGKSFIQLDHPQRIFGLKHEQMINMYNRFFTGYYYFLKKIKNDSPIDTAILLVIAAQFFHVAFIIGIIQTILGRAIIPQVSSKYYYLIVIIPWIIVVYIYYNKGKIKK